MRLISVMIAHLFAACEGDLLITEGLIFATSRRFNRNTFCVRSVLSPISYTAQKPHRDTIEALASVGLDEVTSENLIRLYGKGAHRVIVNLIDGAIDRNQSDEALKLDHVRRELAQALGD